MGRMTKITAADGHELGAYLAEPSGKPKGGLVVIMEIFGVNGHVKRLTDMFASKGYLAIAPAMFDRIERDVELGYNQDDFAKGRELRSKLTDEMMVNDVNGAVAAVKSAGKVGLIGYCFGGLVAWIGACQADGLSCSISLYGGGVPARKDDKPKIPVQFHFGDKDAAIPLDGVEALRQAHPDIPLYVYDDAGHGFCCDDRDVFNKAACERATARALDFLAKHVG